MNNPTQPVLPQVSMRWYFIAVVIVAGLLAWILSPTDQQTLLPIVFFMGLTIGCFFCLSAVLFAFAYVIGAVENVLFRPEDQTSSPFAHETMPPQVIPPLSNE